VTLRDTSLTASDLLAFAKPRLPRHMLPRFVEIIEEFPKNESHRILKASLKERGVTLSTWDAEIQAFIVAQGATPTSR
jgi:carnitine-CoA ligase